MDCVKGVHVVTGVGKSGIYQAVCFLYPVTQNEQSNDLNFSRALKDVETLHWNIRSLGEFDMGAYHHDGFVTSRYLQYA